MVLDRSLEPKPEPFRMQPDVEIVIDFGEYLKFVQSLPTGHSFLYFTVDELHQAVEAHNELALIKSCSLQRVTPQVPLLSVTGSVMWWIRKV